jgi:hypothetical protein
LLLPFIAIFLVRVANDRALLGDHANGTWRNVLSLLVLVVVIFLGAHNVWLALGKVFPEILAAVPLATRGWINAVLSLAITGLTVVPALRQATGEQGG